jgi:hypothetical protein
MKPTRPTPCRQCTRTIRTGSGRAIFLFETPTGPAFVCGRACLEAYNEGGEGRTVPASGCPCGAHVRRTA